MIRSVNIRNFKCFKHVKVDDVRKINVIVGDNGAGKTALLEAMFMALGASTELAARYRNQRGLPGTFQAPSNRVGEALFGEYFHNFDFKEEVEIVLSGDGPEARTLRIFRGARAIARTKGRALGRPVDPSAFHFEWQPARGSKYLVTPEVTTEGIKFNGTGEDLPDFSYYTSGTSLSAVENADRFSVLSRRNRQEVFVSALRSTFPWIKSLDIEVVAGSPAIYASIAGSSEKIAVASVSYGINKFLSVLLAIAFRQRSVVLVDELENGLFYRHHRAFWNSLLSFAREFDSQLFITSHSAEWLVALTEAAGEDVSDIALWQVEREASGRHVVYSNDGRALKDVVEFGSDPRGP